MIKLILTCCGIAFSITSAIISFVPESLYLKIKVGMAEIDSISKLQDGNFILMSRLFIFIAVLIICTIFGSIIRTFWWRRRFKGKSYTIIVKYGNLFKQKKCKRLLVLMNALLQKLENHHQILSQILFAVSIC